ncbi:hypothetical protein AM593_08187, partial [Mytilus galloprovincialis]
MDKESIRIYMKALESGSEIKHDIRLFNAEKLEILSFSNIQRMLRSMITQTSGAESPRTANQCERTLDLNIVHPHVSVKEATANVQRRDDLTQFAAILRKQESSDVTDITQHDRELREIIDSAKDMDDMEYASLSFWDFAGDREFYTTHQTFLSEEAVYLVVTKLNEKDDVTKETLKFWFDSIHFYGSMHSNTNEDSEKVNRSNTDNENIYTGNALMHTNDHQHVPNNKGITTCDNDLNPPIIAIGTHKDQCKLTTQKFEIKRLNTTNPTKNRGGSQILQKGKF